MADETICPKCSTLNPKDTVFCGKCGTKIPQRTGEQEAVDPLIGSFVGDRFLVHEKLGEGGMGVVYRAEQTAIKREVALKVLHTNLNDDSLFVRFQNEAAAASRLNHPNTITIFDFGKTEMNSLYIAMEFVKGISLDDEILSGGAMNVARASQIGMQICGSLQDAHDNGIIHRDLKPENVMLCERAGEKDVVKVLDFGIAKIVEDDGQDQRKALTKTGMVFGTPQYMSPEQIRGEKVDNRSDIYSLGIMLYQMLTGNLPFTSETPMGLLTKHLMETPAPLEPHGIPSSIAKVVMASLEKDINKRPASMKDFAGMIATASGITLGMSNVTAATAPASAPTALQPRPSMDTGTPFKPVDVQQPAKKKFPMVLVIVLLVLVAGGAAAFFVLNNKGASVKNTNNKVASNSETQMVPPPLSSTIPTLPSTQQAGAQQVAATQPTTAPQQTPTTTPNQAASADAPAQKTPEKPKANKKDNKKETPSKKPDKSAKDNTPETTPTPPSQEKKPQKAVGCSYTNLGANDVLKSVANALRGKDGKIKNCVKSSSEINTAFTFSIPKNENKLQKPRSAMGRAMNPCLQGILRDIRTNQKATSLTSGVAAFTLKKTGDTLTRCKVVVSGRGH